MRPIKIDAIKKTSLTSARVTLAIEAMERAGDWREISNRSTAIYNGVDKLHWIREHLMILGR